MITIDKSISNVLLQYMADLKWNYFQFRQHRKQIYFWKLFYFERFLHLDSERTEREFHPAVFYLGHSSVVFKKCGSLPVISGGKGCEVQFDLHASWYLSWSGWSCFTLAVRLYEPTSLLQCSVASQSLMHRLSLSLPPSPVSLSLSLSTEEPKLVQRKSTFVFIHITDMLIFVCLVWVYTCATCVCVHIMWVKRLLDVSSSCF